MEARFVPDAATMSRAVVRAYPFSSRQRLAPSSRSSRCPMTAAYPACRHLCKTRVYMPGTDGTCGTREVRPVRSVGEVHRTGRGGADLRGDLGQHGHRDVVVDGEDDQRLA